MNPISFSAQPTALGRQSRSRSQREYMQFREKRHANSAPVGHSDATAVLSKICEASAALHARDERSAGFVSIAHFGSLPEFDCTSNPFHLTPTHRHEIERER